LSEIQEPNRYSKREGYCGYNAAKPINDVRNTLGHRPPPPTWYLQKWIGRTFLNLSKELKEVENCRAQAKGKPRLADKYGAAQERGEVATAHDGNHRRSDRVRLSNAKDNGLTRKQIHEARAVRNAEKADAGDCM
jgi:hypothetical protein